MFRHPSPGRPWGEARSSLVARATVVPLLALPPGRHCSSSLAKLPSCRSVARVAQSWIFFIYFALCVAIAVKKLSASFCISSRQSSVTVREFFRRRKQAETEEQKKRKEKKNCKLFGSCRAGVGVGAVAETRSRTFQPSLCARVAEPLSLSRPFH